MNRILVVDDDLDTQYLLREWFTAEADRFAVTITSSAEAALERLAKERFSTLVTDVFLPGMDGVELLLAARRLHPSIRVVVMSAFGSPELEAAALDSGAIRFLGKPLDFTELARAISVEDESVAGLSRLAGDLDLFDLCLLFLLSARRGGLRVESEEQSGLLVFSDGFLIHVSSAERTGASAFKALAESSGLDFATLPPAAVEEAPENLRVDAAGLLRARNRLRSGLFGGSLSDLQWRASGVASGLDLRDLLRVVSSERRTCAITASSGSRVGVLILRDGELVDADSGSQDGLAAVREILSWPHVEIEVRQSASLAASSDERLPLDELLGVNDGPS